MSYGPEGEQLTESEWDEWRAEQHGECAQCGGDVCCADVARNVGRENCWCDGDVPEALYVGESDPLCSDACMVLYLAGAALDVPCDPSVKARWES